MLSVLSPGASLAHGKTLDVLGLEVQLVMSRSRISTAQGLARLERTISATTGSGTSSVTAGALAAATWLRARGTTPPIGTRWHVEIALDVLDAPAPRDFDEKTATRFHLDIYAEEWGVYFCHGGRASWIRVTDIAFVHGRDDFHLLDLMPPLKDIAGLIRRLEQMHAVRFQREHAAVRTNLAAAEPSIRSWLATL